MRKRDGSNLLQEFRVGDCMHTEDFSESWTALLRIDAIQSLETSAFLQMLSHHRQRQRCMRIVTSRTCMNRKYVAAGIFKCCPCPLFGNRCQSRKGWPPSACIFQHTLRARMRDFGRYDGGREQFVPVLPCSFASLCDSKVISRALLEIVKDVN